MTVFNRRLPVLSRRFWLILIGLCFIVWSLLFIRQSSIVGIDGRRYFVLYDDSMISMGYAWNLTHGLGLVWSEGVRVEGITNLLMTLYMAIWTLVFNKSIAVLMVQLSGVAFTLILATLTVKLSDELWRESANTLRSLLVFGLSLAYYPLNFWALMGMETPLVGIWILSALWLLMRSRDNPDFNIWIPVVLGLGFMTRPGVLIPAVIIMLYRWAVIAQVPGSRAAVIKETGILAGVVGAVTLFRLGYYGAAVPNTYDLKVSNIPLDMRLLNGLAYTTAYLRLIGLPLLLASVHTVLNPQREKLLLLILIVAALIYTIWVGGDGLGEHIANHPRIVIPYIPLLFILILDALLGKKQLPGTVSAVVCAMCLILINDGLTDFILLRTKPPAFSYNKINLDSALAIEAVTTPEATIAVFWAGTPAYYTERNSIDLHGVSDRHIARLSPTFYDPVHWWRYTPGHNKLDVEYSLINQQPDYVEAMYQATLWMEEYPNALSDYGLYEYHSVPLWLNQESQNIRWDQLEPFTDLNDD